MTSPVIELSFTVIVFGAHRAVSLSVNCASGLWNTVIVSDVIILSHPLGSPTISCITYKLSLLNDVLLSVNTGVDTPFVITVLSRVLLPTFHSSHVYVPIELFIVVSVVSAFWVMIYGPSRIIMGLIAIVMI